MRSNLLVGIQTIGSTLVLYQVSRYNFNTGIKILGATYVVAASAAYYLEGSENKFREALLIYNQALLKK